MKIAPIVKEDPPEVAVVVVAMIVRDEGKAMISSHMAVIHDQAMATVLPILVIMIATVRDLVLQKVETSQRRNTITTKSNKTPPIIYDWGILLPLPLQTEKKWVPFLF